MKYGNKFSSTAIIFNSEIYKYFQLIIKTLEELQLLLSINIFSEVFQSDWAIISYN